MNWFDDNIGDDLSKALINIKITLLNGTIERDVRPDILIDYEMLEEQLQNTPAIYSFWSMVLAEGKQQAATFERAVERRKGEVTKELLDEARRAGVKLRGSDVKDLIEADDKLNNLEAKLILANKTLSKLFAVVEALRMKSEHLRSLAGFKRQEQRDS